MIGLLLAQEQPDHPWELYRCPLTEAGAGELERLTHFSDALLSEVALGKTEYLRYQEANGDEIDGWLIHPVGARAGVRYPLMVHIHGGSHWAYGTGNRSVLPLFRHPGVRGLLLQSLWEYRLR